MQQLILCWIESKEALLSAFDFNNDSFSEGAVNAWHS